MTADLRHDVDRQLRSYLERLAAEGPTYTPYASKDRQVANEAYHSGFTDFWVSRLGTNSYTYMEQCDKARELFEMGQHRLEAITPKGCEALDIDGWSAGEEKPRLTVTLSVTQTPEPRRNGVVPDLSDIPCYTARVPDFRTASFICMRYVAINQADAYWDGGVVKDGRRVIGYVGSNGRIWRKEDAKTCIFEPDDKVQFLPGTGWLVSQAQFDEADQRERVTFRIDLYRNKPIRTALNRWGADQKPALADKDALMAVLDIWRREQASKEMGERSD